jgi:thymidylate kinase
MRVFLEGPQGSGKTSISQLLSHQLSQREIYIPTLRGIPDGLFLKSHTEEENWEKSLELIQSCPAIFDRSPLSITVFDAQEHVIGSRIWEHHLPVFLRYVKETDLIVFLKCTPERAFARQGLETLCSLECLAEAQAEHERYSKLWKIIEAEKNLEGAKLEVLYIDTEDKDPEASVDAILEYLYSKESFHPYLN